MKKILLSLSYIFITILSLAQVHVNGYYRANGTYVQPYTRSSPDGNPYNNYSYPGNTNPYTGKVATGNADTYLKNYYKGNGGFGNSEARYIINNSSIIGEDAYLKIFGKGDSYLAFNIYNSSNVYLGFLSLNADRTLRIYNTSNVVTQTINNFNLDITPIDGYTNSAQDYRTEQTVEKRIKYKDGLVVCNILLENPPSYKFDDSLTYTWYNEYSSIKYTKGGCGGTLLHGRYQAFSLNGDLEVSCNYSYGLFDGEYKKWNEKGELIETYNYNHGVLIYSKEKNKSGFDVEFTNVPKMFKYGGVRNIYSELGNLVEQDINRDTVKQITLYYDNPSKKIEAVFNTNILIPDFRYGEYQGYFEDGKTKVIGNYYDGTDLKKDTWTYYKEDGTVDYEEKFQIVDEKFPNGQSSVQGDLLWFNNNWVRDGNWHYYNEAGMLLKKISYDPFKPQLPKKSKNQKHLLN